MTMSVKPTPEQLGAFDAAIRWHASGHLAGAVEVAFTWADGQQWALMRINGDPGRRVLVFSRFEWDCFLDGARNGEFDDAASIPDVKEAASSEPCISRREAVPDSEPGAR